MLCVVVLYGVVFCEVFEQQLTVAVEAVVAQLRKNGGHRVSFVVNNVKVTSQTWLISVINYLKSQVRTQSIFSYQLPQNRKCRRNLFLLSIT